MCAGSLSLSNKQFKFNKMLKSKSTIIMNMMKTLMKSCDIKATIIKIAINSSMK